MAEQTGNDKDQARRRRGLLPGILLIALIVVLILLLLNFFSGNASQVAVERRTSVVVPDVIGLTESDATERLVAAGFRVDAVTRSSASSATAGTVTSQVPAGGDSLARGAVVAITVADDTPGLGDGAGIPVKEKPNSVPDVVGHPRSRAISDIASAGYNVDVTEMYSDTVPKGQVLAQNPSGGTNLEPGETVGIVISSGKETVQKVTVPSILGLTRAQASSRLSAVGLRAYAMYGTQPAGKGGHVANQWPEAGSVVTVGTEVFFQTGY